MTSSLVGSEMCIRDRVKRGHGEAGGSDDGKECPRRGSREDTGIVDAQKAVSYTHLTLPTICSV
eukprot:8582471-Prorocentrum_lima.AAC.1